MYNFFFCRNRTNMEGDVYNFGFILLESLVGPIVSGKGETFLLNEMVCKIFCCNEFWFCRIIYQNTLNIKSLSPYVLHYIWNWTFDVWCNVNELQAGIVWQPRRSKKNCRSNRIDDLLTRVVINCGIYHQKMYMSRSVSSSVIWGCALELTVCSSSPGHCWCWSEIRFYVLTCKFMGCATLQAQCDNWYYLWSLLLLLV